LNDFNTKITIALEGSREDYFQLEIEKILSETCCKYLPRAQYHQPAVVSRYDYIKLNCSSPSKTERGVRHFNDSIRRSNCCAVCVYTEFLDRRGGQFSETRVVEAKRMHCDIECAQECVRFIH
jgi:hypothetical protein